jgi:hypothetical protein
MKHQAKYCDWNMCCLNPMHLFDEMTCIIMCKYTIQYNIMKPPSLLSSEYIYVIFVCNLSCFYEAKFAVIDVEIYLSQTCPHFIVQDLV